MTRQRDLTLGSPGRAIFGLAAPMSIGLLSVVAFNLIDAMFVAQLGTTPLAAIGFTFPVVSLVGALSMGLGIGATSVASRAIGAADRHEVKLLATGALTLGLLVVTAVAVPLYFSLEPLFLALGADAQTLPLILDYMQVWTLGMVFLVVPMIGNSLLRAGGDTRTPALVMVIAGVVNGVLDAVLIFGLGPIPAMGLEGAALATVIGRATTLVFTLWLLAHRERILTLRPGWRPLLRAWRRILGVGLPAAAGQLAVPVSNTILTAIIASLGAVGVAAFGAGARVQMLALVPVYALGAGLAPFVGQHVGAGAHDRLAHGLRLALKWAAGLGAVVAVALFALADPIAAAFSDDAATASLIADYLRVVPLGFFAHGVYMVTTSSFNAMGRPLRAAALTLLRAPVALVAFAWLGADLAGFAGAFASVAAADLLAGGLSLWQLRPHLSVEPEPELEAPPAHAHPVTI